jgi:ribose transport system ATP-binding protein
MIELRHVSKSFNGNYALKEISFTAYPGEIHALMGQNGAGKSTLMKILSGAYSLDAGAIKINGKEIHIKTPQDAEQNGISIVYQELSTLPHLSVAENIVIGSEPLNKLGLLDKKKAKEIARAALNRLGVTIDPDTKMGDLSVSQQQICEIAKAISKESRIVVFDEPTAALTNAERKNLFQIMRKMRSEGLILIFISHHLEEIFEMSDRCTVLRDGQLVYTGQIADIDEYKLVQLMVGYAIDNFYPKRQSSPRDKIALELKGYGGGIVQPIDLKLHYGEIVGISGLIGAGRTELARMIFGVDHVSYGEMFIDGRSVKVKHPEQAIKEGIALITEDRRIDGLALNLSVKFNISFPSIVFDKNKISKGKLVFSKVERDLAESLVQRAKIKCSSIHENAVNLSGGNQQKTAIAKWVATQSKIYIFDEPTKGIDVASKVEVYKLINDLADQGAAILVISSYNPELIGICDRINVMSRGRFVKEFDSNVSETELILSQSV